MTRNMLANPEESVQRKAARSPDAGREKGGALARQATTPVLLDVQAVAQILGCSERHVYRLSDAGKMPAPVKLGALNRWKATGPGSIGEWVDHDCKPVRTVTAKEGGRRRPKRG